VQAPQDLPAELLGLLVLQGLNDRWDPAFVVQALQAQRVPLGLVLQGQLGLVLLVLVLQGQLVRVGYLVACLFTP
jgi:hypothetical protein